jgi:hypothetical protein
VVVPKEAETVKRIFALFLAGKGIEAIAKILNADGIPTRQGKRWGKSGVSKVLRNYSYTGNLLLQKTYRENHLTKRTLMNHGELPQYHAAHTHEAIIDLDTFQAHPPRCHAKNLPVHRTAGLRRLRQALPEEDDQDRPGMDLCYLQPVRKSRLSV